MTHGPSSARNGRTVHGRDGPGTPPSEPSPLTRVHARDLADALWLASEHAWLTGVIDRAPEPERPGDDDARERDQELRGPSGAPRSGTSSPGDTGRPPGAGADDERDPRPPSGSAVPRPVSDDGAARPVGSVQERAVRDARAAGRPVPLSGSRMPLPDGPRWPVPPGGAGHSGNRALGRAMRPFRTVVGSPYASELDEEATAERIALAPGLPPRMRPAAERRWRALLVTDSAPQMAVWRDATSRFARVARCFGGFRDVTELTLDASSAAVATVSAPDATAARRTPPRSLVDPTGRSVVFVLTDGSAPAWRSGAAQRLLAQWGKQQPVAVLHMLPQRLWHRTGLDPLRIRLRALGPWPAERRPVWEPAEAAAEALASRAARTAAVPVPVLELDSRWLAPWTRFVGGDEPREVELSAILASPLTGPPEPSPTPLALTPADQVAAFRAWASPEAFLLATRMAAIQLDLRTMTGVQLHTMPHTGTEHMAEFLLSGLVVPLPRYGDTPSFLFSPGVREELLAYGSRNATERVIRHAAELLAPRNEAARDLLSYLSGRQEPASGVRGTDREFREVERAVLHALSGPHARRARELDAIEAHGRGHSGSPHATGRGAAPRAPDSPERSVSEAPGSSLSVWPQSSGEGSFTAASPSGGGTGADRKEGETSVSTVPAAPEREQEQRPTAGTPRAARPAVWGNMPPRNLVFTGRDALLVALEKGLRSGPTAVLPHALHGMGGVGKSQLALEFVYRHAAEYDLVWWIPAERPTQIQQAFVELARRMHLPVSSEAITAVPAVLEALRTGVPYGNWLLVFDNAESPHAVQEYFPSAPEGGPTGSVIVTSRNPQWNTLAHPLEVDVFHRSESIQLLRRRNPDLTDDEADMLAEVLGDLPLAVEQASAWRAETGMPPAEYLRVFEEKRAELMAVSPPTQYEETVATAWNVSLDHVETKNPGALQLLQLCSYFAPEPISRQFFSNAVAEPIAPELDLIFTDPIRLSRAIREINRYSLAKIDHRTNSIQMHRLVQAVLNARMTEEQRERFRHGAQLLLAANAPSDPRDPRSWGRFGELYSHVIVSEALESPHRHVRQLVYNVAEYLFYWGDHAAALDFATQVYSTWRERFGEGDPQTLVLGRHLRFVMWRMGRYSAAAELGERMLATLEAAGPELEEEYLRVKGQVSSDRRVRGDFAGALEFDEDVYNRAVRAFGDDDPDTLLHAFNLAVCLRVNGDFQRALELDQAVWRQRVQMFGTDNPITLGSEASVALDRQELGDYTQALGMCEEGVEKSRDVYGESHPSTFQAIARLGVAQRKAGMHAEAAENTRIALAALAERYGERAPDVLQISLNFSIDLRQNGDLQEAMRLGERTRKLYAETLGTDHPHTISADVDLAVTLRLLGRVDAARKLNESALTRFKESLGETHPCTLVTAINLANDLFAQADAAGARDLDERTLERVEAKLGGTHPTTLVLRANLAADLRALGQVAEAAALHTEVVEAIKEKLGSAHPAYQDALAWRRANCDIDPMHL